MKNKKIIIVLEGGIIQDINGIPEGMEIEVRDFDEADSYDPKHPNMEMEKFGDYWAWVTTWKAGGRSQYEEL